MRYIKCYFKLKPTISQATSPSFNYFIA